jgi:hopene-associated glycosyltransferase HpnB
VFFFFKLYPPNWIANARSRTAGAAGGCVLIRPEALKNAGGIERIRAEIIDDCSLAAEVKKRGGKIWLALTDSARSIRPYETFSEIARMIARTAFNQLGHSVFMLAIAVLGLIFTYIAPVAALFSGNRLAVVLGALTLILMFIAFSPIIRYFRLNPLWTVAVPFAALFYMGATIQSAINYWSGRGGRWKGRIQDRAGATHA